MYLLESHGGARMRVSATAHRILSRRWSGAAFEEIAREFRDAGVAGATAAHMAESYDALAARVRAADARARVTDRSYLVRFTLIPAAVVERLARPFTVLYSGLAAIPLIAFTAICLAFWTAVVTRSPSVAGHHDAQVYATAYGLFVVSLVFHEFGHASASMRFGQRPGGIGFTLYLTLPALYADVTSSWKLPRMQRVVVDAGGTYFQLVFAALYVVAYAVTGRFEFHAAVLMIVAVSLLNLNPLFKFDGYWILADLLGITNLSRQAPRIFRAVFDRALGRSPTLGLPWRGRTIAFLFAYAVAAAAAWAYFLHRIAGSIAGQARSLAHAAVLVAQHRMTLGDVGVRTLLTTFGLLFSTYLVGRLTLALLKSSSATVLSTIRTLRKTQILKDTDIHAA